MTHLRVFISYSHADKLIVSEIGRRFDALRLSYFLDEKNIHLGQSVPDRVTDDIPTCSHLLVVVSPASRKSQWVPYEIGLAQGRGLTIIPFLTHGSEDPFPFIRNVKYTTDLDELQEYFEDLLKAQPAPPPNPKPFRLGDFTLSQAYLMFGNHTSEIAVDTVYAHSPLPLAGDIQEVYSFLAGQAKRNALATGTQYFNGPNTRLIRFSETTHQERSGYEDKGIRLVLGPVSWEEYTVLNTYLDHRLSTGRTIRESYARPELAWDNDRDFTWCCLSSILSVTMVPITSDGYALVQFRNPQGVSSEGSKYTGGIAENIHRYLDEVDTRDPRRRLHPLSTPSDLVAEGEVDESYRPAEGHTLNPYLTASRGLWEEVSEQLFDLVPGTAYKFLNIVFRLDTFTPMLNGVVDLGEPWTTIDRLIKESPGRDHAEHRRIEPVPLDPTHRAVDTLLQKDWVSGGLAAFISAVHYWRSRR